MGRDIYWNDHIDSQTIWLEVEGDREAPAYLFRSEESQYPAQSDKKKKKKKESIVNHS